jgi:hypothetical protein
MMTKSILGFVLLAIIACGLDAVAGQANELFRPAMEEIRGQTKIPILLPSKLPAETNESAIKSVSGDLTNTGYNISLYYEEGCGNACYAGMLEGSSHILKKIPNTQPAKLNNGIKAKFRPVSCGGSCAPANLWWEQAGAMYSIQIKLNRKMSVNEQKRILVEMANSMTLAR